MTAPVCPYCEELSVFTDSSEVYGGRSYGMIYLCRPCHAWVGVHKGTETPLGRLADKKLREAKRAAHAAFDPLWRRKMAKEQCRKKDARGAAYQWLAMGMNIRFQDCHIGMFDVDQCRQVVELCAPYSVVERRR